jgi:diaminohydroxyphosphoribosylaminopyrimidine deaminase / 5-amino-6-(5-phosphoribosylamino)uracil reductase
MAESLDRAAGAAVFRAGAAGDLIPAPEGAHDAVLAWQPGRGWSSRLLAADPRAPLVDLYLPVCSATRARPITIGHLGQSLDGFIALPSGESHFVTGPENLVHMHRLRALCDAVVVGAGTVAADDPRLTTRLVAGDSPLRVVFDPEGRLPATARVFTDGAAETLYASAGLREGGHGRAESLVLTAGDAGGMRELVATLHARGCVRIFVEGGGVTVSACVEAGVLDRLQIAIAPVLIGEGRPGIRLTPPTRLSACRRPRCRVFRMGHDILWDCDLRAAPEDGVPAPALTRIV